MRLRLHTLIHGVKPWRQGLHLLDNLRQLSPHRSDILHPLAHLLGKLVHPHDAR